MKFVLRGEDIAFGVSTTLSFSFGYLMHNVNNGVWSFIALAGILLVSSTVGSTVGSAIADKIIPSKFKKSPDKSE